MIRLLCSSFVLAVICAACWDPDPRNIRGALDLASRAVEAGDARQLFKVVDERGRHALISIVQDRRAAAELVRTEYPAQERAAALRALGDAADAVDAADLFARRCGEACMAELRAKLGAPVEQRERGDEVEVETSRGGILRMHAGGDGWWGLVWNTETLSRERDHAAQELRQITRNAELYRRRRGLERSADSALGNASQGSTPSDR